MDQINEVDREVLRSLSGGEKAKALLRARGLSLTDFARKYNHWVEDVSRCFAGDQPLHKIRDSLALELGWTRDQVDELLAQKAVA